MTTIYTSPPLVEKYMGTLFWSVLFSYILKYINPEIANDGRFVLTSYCQRIIKDYVRNEKKDKKEVVDQLMQLVSDSITKTLNAYNNYGLNVDELREMFEGNGIEEKTRAQLTAFIMNL